MPSVFKLSLSMKRTRPRTLGGKPAMISTEAGGFGFLWARRAEVPAARSAKFLGAQINPANALAATTAGEPKYTYASRSPMRPLKLRLVALIAVSPFCTRPRPSPIHAPHPGGSGIAPAPNRVCQSPVDSTWLALQRSLGRDKIPHRRQRGRPWRAQLLRRHANPRNVRSRTTTNTLSEWTHAFVPFQGAIPLFLPR